MRMRNTDVFAPLHPDGDWHGCHHIAGSETVLSLDAAAIMRNVRRGAAAGL